MFLHSSAATSATRPKQVTARVRSPCVSETAASRHPLREGGDLLGSTDHVHALRDLRRGSDFAPLSPPRAPPQP